MADVSRVKVEKALRLVLFRLYAIAGGAEATKPEIEKLLRQEERGEAMMGIGAERAVTQSAKAWIDEGHGCPYCGGACHETIPF